MVDKSYLLELTSAEQAATEIIRKAQDARDRRMKEAKFDAEQELGKLKKEMDDKFNEAVKKNEEGADPELVALQDSYRIKAGEAVNTFNAHKNEAIEFLVQSVFKVNTEVPKVVIGKFD